MWDNHIQIHTNEGLRAAENSGSGKHKSSGDTSFSASCYIVEYLSLWLAEGGYLISVYSTPITFFLFVAELSQADRLAKVSVLQQFGHGFRC